MSRVYPIMTGGIFDEKKVGLDFILPTLNLESSLQPNAIKLRIYVFIFNVFLIVKIFFRHDMALSLRPRPKRPKGVLENFKELFYEAVKYYS